MGRLSTLWRFAREVVSVLGDLASLGVDIKGYVWALVPLLATGSLALKEGYVLLAVVGAPLATFLWLVIYQYVRWRPLRMSGVSPVMALDRYCDPGLVARRIDTFLKQHYIEGRLSLVVRRLARRDRSAATNGVPVIPGALDAERDELVQQLEWAEVERDAADSAVRGDLHGKLFRGELIAHGFRLPHTHGQQSVDIPRLEWDFLLFEDDMVEARGNGISYRVVLIRKG